MSATNKTAVYELPIFLGTDVPSWLTDWNGAMGDIDTAIAAAKAAADAAASTAGTAATDIVTINGQITSLQNTVGTHTTQIGTISGNINTINSLIGNGTPTTTDQTLIGAINELHANQGDLADLTTTDKSSLVAAINEAAQGGGGSPAASAVSYDNTGSGLTATNVQDAIDEIAGSGSLTQKLPTMTSNSHADGTASGNAHGGVTDYYKAIDGSALAANAIELAGTGEYLQFTFTNPTYVDHVSYRGIGFSNTVGTDLTADFSEDGTFWTTGAVQINPANGVETAYEQTVKKTVKAIRVYNHSGAGSVKVYKIEAF